MRKHLHSRSSRTRTVTLFVAACLTGIACGGGSDTPQKPVAPSLPPQAQPSPPSTPAEPAKPSPPTTPLQPPSPTSPSGSITGQVLFAGNVPPREKLEVNKDLAVCGKTEKLSEALVMGQNKAIQDAVVFIKAVKDTKPLPPLQQNPVLDQAGCQYKPHILLIPVGATVDIKNSDGILHNIHTYSTKNPSFNTAQPKFQKLISKTFAQPERIRVTCDVHGWMTAWIVVQEHPYYTLTDTNGAFRLSDVPAGDYKLVVWNEKLGEQSVSVKVVPSQEATVMVTMAAAG